MLKNEENLIIFLDNLLQFYDVGMIQFPEDLEKALLFIAIKYIHGKEHIIVKSQKEISIKFTRLRGLFRLTCGIQDRLKIPMAHTLISLNLQYSSQK